MKHKQNLSKMLNLSWTKLTNTTPATGQWDLPMLSCNTSIIPTFLALYGEPGHYQENGSLTGVCFYSYDAEFDGVHGLYEAIYHDDQRQLEYYQRRFAGVKIFISPDYSQFGDIHNIENVYRLFKAAIVSLWLTNELHAVVIPSITGASENILQLLLASLHNCSVVAFSTKGHMNSSTERERLARMIRITVDTLELNSIVVYDCCGDNEQVLDVFSYAVRQGIHVLIPDNTLKRRNRQRKDTNERL